LDLLKNCCHYITFDFYKIQNNMRSFLAFSILLFLAFSTFSRSLKVSENGRYLTRPDGSAFLWIGDTAWELFHKLDQEEAAEYLKNRKAKGFTIIQAVVLAENDGLRTANPYGEVPFIDLDPTKPNEAYFQHVDFIVNKAEELGLFIGMLPSWGDKIYSKNPGAGPIVFNKENAKIYGEFLGQRYKDKSIVWILGGDRNIANDEVLEIWRNMAAGIKSGDGGNHLITYHPRGASSSSRSLHNEEWLDFNMYQSGHDKHFNQVYRYAKNDRAISPPKPTIDGEPAYEDIAIRFWDYMDFSKPSMQRVPAGVLDEKGLIKDRAHYEAGFFDDYDVRIHAYWNFLAGAAGYTYGNNAIWQMFKADRNLAIPCLYDWRKSMDRPGAENMKHVNKFFTKYPFEKLVPAQDIILGDNPKNEDHIQAANASDNSFVLVYLAKGQAVKLDLSQFPKIKKASWYDPRDGKFEKGGKVDVKGIVEFTPPSSGIGNDWMLVLE
jgi:hypothetical protein